MGTCMRCGGPLTADLQWCPRCLAPVERTPEPFAASIGYRLPPREPPPVPVYSRWKAGPTSFGAVGRIVMTVLVLLGAVAGYPMSRGGIFAAIGFDVPGTPFLIAYCVVAGCGVAYALSRVWKRARIE